MRAGDGNNHELNANDDTSPSPCRRELRGKHAERPVRGRRLRARQQVHRGGRSQWQRGRRLQVHQLHALAVPHFHVRAAGEEVLPRGFPDLPDSEAATQDSHQDEVSSHRVYAALLNFFFLVLMFGKISLGKLRGKKNVVCDCVLYVFRDQPH